MKCNLSILDGVEGIVCIVPDSSVEDVNVYRCRFWCNVV